MEKRDAAIWFVQVDHLSGESLGAAVSRLMKLGVKNVHIIPTITKKNRPGHILILDVNDLEKSKEIEAFLTHELGISGYHRLLTEHFCETTNSIERNLWVNNKEKTINHNIRLKVMGDYPKPTSVRVEHDSLLEIQERIQDELEVYLSLTKLTAMVQASLDLNCNEIRIDL